VKEMVTCWQMFTGRPQKNDSVGISNKRLFLRLRGRRNNRFARDFTETSCTSVLLLQNGPSPRFVFNFRPKQNVLPAATFVCVLQLCNYVIVMEYGKARAELPHDADLYPAFVRRA
jgi:hypothetical protein